MLKVLIAEDDLMIADMVEEILIKHGYEVCGIARTVSDAIELGLRHKPDLAVLDLRLADGGLGTEVAAHLRGGSRLGVLYATGNTFQLTLTSDQGDACLSKPYRTADLLRGLEVVTDIIATGGSTRAVPRGLVVLPVGPPATSGYVV